MEYSSLHADRGLVHDRRSWDYSTRGCRSIDIWTCASFAVPAEEQDYGRDSYEMGNRLDKIH